MYMKKIFLSAVIALALCSYGYAQDEEEYEEDEAPAKVTKAPAYEEEEEEEEAAPVAKKAEKKKAAKKSGDTPFFGLGVDLVGSLKDEAIIRLVFKPTASIEVAGLIGLWHHGETTFKPKTGDEQSYSDNYTDIAVGVGFDYLMPTAYLPFTVGGEFLFSSPSPETALGDAIANFQGKLSDVSVVRIRFNVLAGAEAELIKGLTLNGKAGLGFDYWSYDVVDVGTTSWLDLGFVTRVYLTWYMF